VKRLVRWLLGTLLLGVAIGGWFYTTTTGLGVLLRAGASLSAAELDYESLSGSLVSGPEITGLHISTGTAVIEVESLHAECKCAWLMFGAIHLSEFEATGLRIRIVGTEALAATDTRLPPITIEHARVSDLQIILPEDPAPYAIDEIRLSIMVDSDMLIIGDLSLESEAYRMTGGL